MSKIKGINTKPEILIRKFLFFKGFRFRIHVKNMPGKPDIVLPKYKTVIFVNGCFWHRHDGCTKAKNPASNIEFWQNKFDANMKRDRINIGLLTNNGWQVVVVWECQLTKRNIDQTLENVMIEILRKN